jgi:hypothetical protein
MSLAALYLVCWDYDRWKPIVFSKRERRAELPRLEFLWLPCLFALAGAGLTTFFAWAHVANIQNKFAPVLLAVSASGFVFGLICSLHHKFMPIGSLKKPAGSI